MELKELPHPYIKGANKTKNKRIKRLLQSDAGTADAHSKL